MSSYSRQQLEKWLKEIPSIEGKVLDVGGSQNPIIKRLNPSATNFDEYKIFDLYEPHEGKKPDFCGDLNNSDLILTKLDNSPLGGSRLSLDDSVDVIFCIEVMEYIWNPLSALTLMSNWLKKDGILYISFHFVYPIHNPLGEDCLRYTEFGVKKLLKETGFEIEDLQYRTSEVLEPMIVYSAEQMRPSKEYDKHNVVGYLVRAKKI